ncbi:glycosyltransferase family 4 protein [Patescibacteria group bacterium]|nr:glycosyltransferase family 4 protein [Patescibacteria group bacterium]MBU1895664.1 glycosyltransferase family 4 protein [Patescibacteria group bacterium]
MKIAFIGQKGIELKEGAGGIERHVFELSRGFASKGHDILVYVRPRFFDSEKKEEKNIKIIPVLSIPTKNLDTFTYSLFATLSVMREKVDVIHYHGIGPATLAWIPRLFKRKSKVIVTFHSIDRLHSKWGVMARLFLRYAEWTAIKFPHATIVVSHSIAKYCREKYNANTIYIPNGAIVEKYPGDNLISEWGLKCDGYILNVARLVKQKGIHFLIEAYARLDTDKKLVIVGAPSFSEEYNKYIHELSQGNSDIIFTGFQKGKVLSQLYVNCYLYVQPSESEGLSMSVLEAMAAERCVLVSNIPENIESIDHAGLTFVSADVDDLQEKIEPLLNHPEIVEERGKKSKRWVEENFNWEGIVEKTEKIYLKN